VVPGAEIESLAMATTMVIGMVAWMRYRGHEWRHIAEMSAAMYAGFVVLFPALWLEMLDRRPHAGLRARVDADLHAAGDALAPRSLC
jgi:hypothetical protein